MRGGRASRFSALPIGLGLLAIGLGFIGYLDATPKLSASSALYRSLQLLVIDYKGPASGAPWTLEVARYLAAFVVAYALIAVAAALARERAGLLRLRLLTRGHYVVIGLGTYGAASAARLRGTQRTVAAVESNPAGPRVPGTRSHRVPVIIGDGRDRRILERVELPRASHVLVGSGGGFDELGDSRPLPGAS